MNSIPRLGKTIFTITSRNFQGHSIAAPVWHNSAVGECWELDLGVGCHLLGFLILFGGCLALGFSLGLRGDYYLLFLPGLGFGLGCRFLQSRWARAVIREKDTPHRIFWGNLEKRARTVLVGLSLPLSPGLGVLWLGIT